MSALKRYRAERARLEALALASGIKPHRLCGKTHAYARYGKLKGFPEKLCMHCWRARDERKAYLRGYQAGYRAKRRAA